MLVGYGCVYCMISAHRFVYTTLTTEFYTLSLHDALPISFAIVRFPQIKHGPDGNDASRINFGVRHYYMTHTEINTDRKRTRLNSSHRCMSYAIFCVNKKILHIDLSRM